MQYIKIDDDKYIEYTDDNTHSRFISKSSIQNEIDICQQQIQSLPELPSDEFLLAWAKITYMNENMRNREILQASIDSNQAILNSLDGYSLMIVSKKEEII